MKKISLLACALFVVINLSAQTQQVYIENAGCDLNMKMIRVEGGTFQMGSNEGEIDEKPVHSVNLSSYYIAECEITQAQWRKVMGTTVYQQRDKAGAGWSMCGVGSSYPMYYVSWEEAQEFCRRLSQRTGRKYALPTEAQWEYAARGGKYSRGCSFSGNYAIAKVAWCEDNSLNQAHPVKQKQPNELGLYDMSGNVREWCRDWYGGSYYSSSPQNNPTGPSSGNDRVLRGGSWNDLAVHCSVSGRFFSYSSDRYFVVGFRVVCIP